jgi:murein DD-endopeptidase MepM/ murein hydrolase activator NlpD
LNRKIKNSAPTLKWNRIFLLSVTISFIVIILLIHFRSSDDIAARDKLISHSLVSYDDYFESRQDWFLNHKRIREHFIKGKTFYELLAEYGISAQNIMLLNKAIKPFFDLSKTKVDQAIDIWLNKKSKRVEKISLHISPDKILHVVRDGHDFFPSLVSPSKITIQTITNGEVYNSFYQSAIDRGIPPEVIMEIADICIGHGKVLAVRFVNQKRIHESFYFNDSKDRSGYYDKRGKSLRKAFLKSPLRYRRISSYFSLRRFHPILKIYRPHYGVDYAAPSGTPVESIGDGRVIFIGWKGGYGRYIRVKHNHIYETGYGHLSRFAKGLKKGSRVRQGDVIGYLGSSGLSTGPHLDFSVTKRGRFVNPLRIKSPPAFILSKEGRERFNELVLQMEEIWQKYQISGLYYL